MISDMKAAGKDTEEIARAVSTRRNEIRLEAFKDDPEGLETVKASNLATYGNENGPTPDYLYEKYGSWETVMEKALSSNPGADACLGLYDKYYDTYIIEDDNKENPQDNNNEETDNKDATKTETKETPKPVTPASNTVASPAPTPYNISDTKVVLENETFTYNGKVNKPTIKTIDGKTLTEGTDYTVNWSDISLKDVGVYTVTITGMGSYTGSTKATYEIDPIGTSIKSLKNSTDGITIIWKKQMKKMSKSEITGYQIQLSTSSDFSKNNKKISIKGFKKTSKNVTGLKSKKMYYVSVRTYKQIQGKKLYSAWSKLKTIKTL